MRSGIYTGFILHIAYEWGSSGLRKMTSMTLHHSWGESCSDWDWSQNDKDKVMCTKAHLRSQPPPQSSELLFILTELSIFPSAVNTEDMRQVRTLAKKYWYAVLCHWDFGNFVVCVLITNLLSQLSTLQFSLAYFPFMTEPAFASIILFYNLTSIDPIFIH